MNTPATSCGISKTVGKEASFGGIYPEILNNKEGCRMKTWNRRICLLTIVVTIIFIAITFRSAGAQGKSSPDAFYKGKNIKFIVPVAPGGAMDLWIRALAPHLEKHTGARILVENVPGAGGLVGSAQLYSTTKPDGLTISVQQMTGLMLADILEMEAATKFDLDKFSYIGRLDVIYRTFFASKTSGFKTIADMQKATKPIRFGVTDKTSASGVDMSIMAEAFGLKAKIIPGFKGSKEYLQAVIAGRELDSSSASIAGFEDYVKSGDLVMVAVQGSKRFPAYPKVATVSETAFAKPEGKKLMELLNALNEPGRMIIGPPGLPEDRRLFLDNALIKSMKEPALIDWAKKNELEVSPLPGDKCKALINRLSELVPKAEKPIYKHLLTEKYFQ
jgi:tripartite-type tricarboxylate transporter receptor subunit TctC